MDKYLQFESIDFAQESSFINWVNASDVSDINQWNKWIADNPEKRAIIDEAKRLVSSIKFKEGDIPSGLENKIWGNIKAATQTKASSSMTEQPSGIVMILKKWAPLAAAAIIALLVYVNVPNSLDYDTEIHTNIAQNEQALLPDGSIIDINAESELAYSKDNWTTNREIKLDGEAFFSVKKGSKFTVVTKNGKVEVLGTSFNVYSRGDIFSVECETGKVRVSTDGKEFELIPNEAVQLNFTENEVSKTNITRKRSEWRRGAFHYKGVAIKQVFDDIERHFDIIIDDTQLTDNQPYKGEFSGTSNIDSVLHKVCWPLNLEINKSNDSYLISSSSK